ncbi:MAG: diphosphomevalonate decarboxylase [Anaerolineae bacterium]|nr:diphosphomevalonate decarboxylase [Anaerolineae bacterium]
MPLGSELSASAVAHPNIAFIKYWGDRDSALHLPANGSISMNLGDLATRTRVVFDSSMRSDELFLNGVLQSGAAVERVRRFLDIVRSLAGQFICARVESENNFPAGAGLASSASAYAALALAASHALGLRLSEIELSRLARRGSGSACRSVPGGFVEWQAGSNDLDCYAFCIAPPKHWALVDCIVLLDTAQKEVGSLQGHVLAATSPLQAARLADAPRRLELCRQAVLSRDFTSLAEIIELDSHLMHAVMMTSAPSLLYWQPATLQVMKSVIGWRRDGLPVCYTIDAGANVHVICEADNAAQVRKLLGALEGVVDVLCSSVGGAVRLVE